MDITFSSLNYRQKTLLTEIIFLFIVCIVIPFCQGLQLFSNFSWTLSLVFVTSLNLPSVILFYRWLLPNTFGKKRYWLFAVLFPVYIIIYEINARLSSLSAIHLPFIPEGYRHNLESGAPGDFSLGWFHQTLGYTCLMLLSNTSLYVVLRLFKNQHTMYALENEKLKLELTHLKSQVQPHFFFNTLNNLYSLSVHGSPKTSPMIADLSGIMRYVLYESQNEKVSLEKEINFIESYIELERIRHDDANIIDFAVQGNTSNVDIEPLIFLPLIENTFKHALAKDIPGKYVKIMMAVDEDELIFQTINPIAKNPALLPGENGGGIGLKNVKKRLELLYPGKHQLDIDKDGDTFTVFLTIRFSNPK